MKILAIIALVIAIGIAGYEATWFGRSSLAPVIFALAVALILQAADLIQGTK